MRHSALLKSVVMTAEVWLVEHADIHVDLADVLMGELGGLEVDDDEAFQDVVIEDEIEVEVAGPCYHAMMNAMKQNQWKSGHEVVNLALKNRQPPVSAKTAPPP